MNLLINLKSNCEFWQLNKEHIEFLKSNLEGFELIFFDDDNDENIKKIKDADFYFGWEFKEEWISKQQN